MPFFRSEKMALCQIYLHNESAYNTVFEIGQLGVVQFNQCSNAQGIRGRYRSEIQRLTALIGILNSIMKRMERHNIQVNPDVEEYNETYPNLAEIDEIEVKILELNEKTKGMQDNSRDSRRVYNQFEEHARVVETGDLFSTGENRDPIYAWSGSVVMTIMQDVINDANYPPMLYTISGSMPANNFYAFERIIWRFFYGTVVIKYKQIPRSTYKIEPNDQKDKIAFIVYFIGSGVNSKIQKLCTSFQATLYEVPASHDARYALIKHLTTNMVLLQSIIKDSDKNIAEILALSVDDLNRWNAIVRKAHAIFTLLDKFCKVPEIQNNKYLHIECWIPVNQKTKVREAIREGMMRTSHGHPATILPPVMIEVPVTHTKRQPTYFTLNKFTRGFQNLIDAYGIASYQELNPAPYTIITFPFLFAVMFGDVGHGLILLIFAATLIRYEKKLEAKKVKGKLNEVSNILFTGRYIILLMGLFAIYTGFVYNTIFSKTMNLFGSHWRVFYETSTVTSNDLLQLDPALQVFYQGTPYEFGLDPIWGIAGEQSITTFNSIKMKISIILGVTQMTFGLILSAVNYLHFKKYPEIYLVFIPQIGFLTCLFTYLMGLIFYKWSMYGGHYQDQYSSRCAPSILITFINMLLFKSPPPVLPECNIRIYPYEEYIELALVITALAFVPILLVGKPLQYIYHKKQAKRIKDEERKRQFKRDTVTSIRRSLVYNVEYMESTTSLQNITGNEPVNMSELWIHQGILCIETVLGSISHTASYLRLWALSLAHDQLAAVLWNMVLATGLHGSRGYLNSLVLSCTFLFWAILTVSILVLMEGLSAFLHTLRLHWVEFQSKFYAGSGEGFVPFRLKMESS